MLCSVRISTFLVDASDVVKASIFNLISSDVVLLWRDTVLKQIRLVVIPPINNNKLNFFVLESYAIVFLEYAKII